MLGTGKPSKQEDEEEILQAHLADGKTTGKQDHRIIRSTRRSYLCQSRSAHEQQQAYRGLPFVILPTRFLLRHERVTRIVRRLRADYKGGNYIKMVLRIMR